MNATAEYTRNAVMTASRGKLVVMMYEGAIRFTEQARFQLARNNVAACGTAISNAYNIVSELKVALDPEAGGPAGEKLVTNLDALYTFVLDSLVNANVNRSVDDLDNVLEIVNTLKEGWDGILDHA